MAFSTRTTNKRRLHAGIRRRAERIELDGWGPDLVRVSHYADPDYGFYQIDDPEHPRVHRNANHQERCVEWYRGENGWFYQIGCADLAAAVGVGMVNMQHISGRR